MTPLRIDIVSDVICPWCFIGARRLDEALRSLPEPVEAIVTYHPFQLDPGTPPEGVDLRERLRQKYGGDPEQMFGRVEAAAREAGIPLDYRKLRRTFSTLAAHTLLRHAAAKGTQKALSEALFSAYFLEGQDIGDKALLAGLAVLHGGFGAGEAERLMRDETELEATRTEAAAMSGQGITGVPFFVFNGKLALSGAQPLEVFRDAIAQATATPRLQSALE